jgi:hypothetical protein
MILPQSCWRDRSINQICKKNITEKRNNLNNMKWSRIKTVWNWTKIYYVTIKKFLKCFKAHRSYSYWMDQVTDTLNLYNTFFPKVFFYLVYLHFWRSNNKFTGCKNQKSVFHFKLILQYIYNPIFKYIYE